MIRRVLGFSPDEWEKMPWWQQRLFTDGLLEMGDAHEPEQTVAHNDFDTPQPL